MEEILIADENSRRAAFIASVLAPPAHTAGSAREAMELMRKGDHPMIIISVSLPDMDGFELYEWLRLNPPTKAARVWFLLDGSDERTAAACKRLGADGVLYGAPARLSALLRQTGLPMR
ncbi:MAG: response regulator [Oscillospiraceae bacterium]|nr:response regulator [Oscillospiraceae bacterium]